ncbi:hypothetical protein BUALT_Bualt12G0117500 [Buddleja alternifolia]|uniref:Uncharacterized protein n=1 Tax=Buddleja alternifolia TaxID=168488 RepID=A0AAV6X180_9LAMI|nr:hypothetical protein BUALT_Bualt12G0117500 [Buddleja alternifolia]
MEISVISETISSIAYVSQGLTFSNLLLNRPHNILSDQPPQSQPSFHVSAASPPPTRTLTKRRLRRSRRVKRKLLTGDGGEESGYFVFGDGGGLNSGDGYFGSGGGGNFGGNGGANWEDYSDNSVSDPAFDFVYKVLCWIAMSNCLIFALKKVVRRFGDGFGDRQKIPMRLTAVC